MITQTQPINRPKNSKPFQIGMGVYSNKETGELQARFRGGKNWKKIGVLVGDNKMEYQSMLNI